MYAEGYFQRDWKYGAILLLLKKPSLDENDPNIVRPISRLPLPAKIIERNMNAQLNKFLHDSLALNPTQYGFRGGHSTETALIKSTEEIRTILDQGGKAVLIKLVLSAAYDTVPHALLMDRLEEIGVKGTAWKLLKSFLSDRRQMVALDDFEAESFSLPCGVPQESSLRPTLFNIYVSSLAPLIESFGFILTSYADDTQIVVIILPEWIQETAARLQYCMNVVGSWMTQNCLILHTGKTEFVLFGNNPNFWTSECWSEASGPLPTPIRKVKNLGIWIDYKLSFRDQGNSVASSTSYIL